MEPGGFLYISFLFDFVYNVLIELYRIFGNDLGVALILLAISSRLLMLPFTLRQLKNVDKNKEFQSKYEEIKKKYAKDKDTQAKELAKLQSQYLPGQLSGCFTLIFQLLLLIQINYVIRNILEYGPEGFNRVAYSFISKFPEGATISPDFLGLVNLGQSAQDQGVTNWSESWPYLLIAGFLVVTQFFSMRILTGLASTQKDREEKAKKEAELKEKTKKRQKGEEEEMPSFAEVFQSTNKQMMLFFPIMIGFFSLNYPSGLSLYFATTSFFVIIQQIVLKRKQIWQNIKERYFVSESDKDDEKVREQKSTKPESETDETKPNKSKKVSENKKEQKRKRKKSKKRKRK